MKSIIKNGLKFFETAENCIQGFDKEKGVLIKVEALPESVDPVEYWLHDTDCFNSRKEVETFLDQSENPFWFCTIEVTVLDSHTFKEGVEYLGCCNYSSGLDFISEDGYFTDMLGAALYRLRGEK